jgi:hypothetical protein
MANAELVLAEAWHIQLMNQYWEVTTLLAKASMVGSALAVRDVFPEAAYAVFETSDQGEYQYLAGAADTRFVHYSDNDEPWPSEWEFRDRDEADWQPYLTGAFNSRHGGTYYMDIEKVLAEVATPWRTLAVRSGMGQVGDGLCGVETDWPGRTCALPGGHPGGHSPSVVPATVKTDGECAVCGGDIEYDGIEWWHSRIETFEHVARPKNGD